MEFITGRFMFMLRVNSNDFHIRHKALQSYETLLFYVTRLYLNYMFSLNLKGVDVKSLKSSKKNNFVDPIERRSALFVLISIYVNFFGLALAASAKNLIKKLLMAFLLRLIIIKKC